MLLFEDLTIVRMRVMMDMIGNHMSLEHWLES